MSDWKVIVGGAAQDLETIYGLHISGNVGCGMYPTDVFIDEYATLPGGEYSGEKVHSRPFVLFGTLTGTTLANLHAQRQALVSLFDTDEPVTLRYTGAAVTKEITAHYEGGLEATFTTDQPCHWERVAIMFLADDPHWYALSSETAALDVYDFATFRYVAARLIDTGQWDELGPPASGGQPFGITVGPDGRVYICGNFLNWNGDPASDYIVVYDPTTGLYSSLGGGLNGVCWSTTFGPDGYLYACGMFHDAGGDLLADHIAKIDPAAAIPAWSNVHGGPGAGAVTIAYYAAFDHDGNLFIAGNFTNWAASGANHLVVWNGAAWGQVGGVNPSDIVYYITVAQDNLVYIGGDFHTIGAVTVNHVAVWDGTAWTALGVGAAGGTIYTLALSPDEYLYVGGTFTSIGHATTNFIARWNGRFWEELAGGLTTGTSVLCLAIGPDRLLYMGGNFSAVGGVPTVSGLAIWNGSCWADPDWRNTAGITYALALGEPDPDNDSRYDVWISHDTNGVARFYAGLITVTNDGTADTYPIITITRAGGTEAVVKSLGNETLGVRLPMSYALLDGETLTLDFTPGNKSVTSSLFGSRFGAILSNIADFKLQPGDNDISCYVYRVGNPTITASIKWTERYKSLD